MSLLGFVLRKGNGINSHLVLTSNLISLMIVLKRILHHTHKKTQPEYPLWFFNINRFYSEVIFLTLIIKFLKLREN